VTEGYSFVLPVAAIAFDICECHFKKRREFTIVLIAKALIWISFYAIVIFGLTHKNKTLKFGTNVCYIVYPIAALLYTIFLVRYNWMSRSIGDNQFDRLHDVV
jgi:hypothetical protein